MVTYSTTATGVILHLAILFLHMCGAIQCNVDPRAVTCELLEPAVQDALREDLRVNNCLREVEIVSPEDATRAARLFHRDGFVVIDNVIDAETIERVKLRVETIAADIKALDPRGLGNRGPKRYSLGGPHKTGSLLHYEEIASLVDLPAIRPALKAIFGNERYVVRGGRGDYNLPGGSTYQVLHSDVWSDFLVDPAVTEFPDSGRLNYRNLPIFNVVVNFLLGNLTALNAPIRQIPGTQNSQRVMPTLDDEPLWMKRSTLCPAPAGAAIIRDPRAWHGGTPNLGDAPRMMPNIEYYPSWYRYQDNGQMTRSMPRDVYDTLSPFGKHICREVVAEPGEEVDASLKDDVILLYSDVMPCYKRLGLTDEDIETFRKNGQVYDYELTQGTTREGFYRRQKTPSHSSQQKDEL